MLLKPIAVKIEDIYVPAGRRKEIDAEKVASTIEKLMDDTDLPPIHVRKGDGRYVLIKGVNRLEARKEVGDEQVEVLVVAARQF